MTDVDAARLRGHRLKTARAARGLTQQELARRAGTTASVISKIECGVTVDSKYQALVLHALGLLDDEETTRCILAARQAQARAEQDAEREARREADLLGALQTLLRLPGDG
jgi:transcriptional regulator with XRE-family HTH domain